ncbi:LytR/AlgR family response regulator transcription factor [Eubacterium callanderi]|uniref:LytR/AlgR family response regulator transcription factor n=1 Tax=Eubacterium callanderi TaxID=53442 RepID=UPI001C10AF28|nr:LytTR family DNA-binding domain-containing protein [Eubacterium callanderi]MBU5305135.1 LytTR family DNA-binding domain-containing protein [Eubacterium callanderi]WPK66098.1 Transcriptional regulatory protein NatR [Eubacterium callanderi]WPK70396.1 Transcriptional regulatory protein NatR [Eubacterium callanderi]
MFRIAICDDERCFRDLLNRELEDYFQKKKIAKECCYFEDGASLLKAACGPRPFALILLDIEMEKMDGIETARYLKEYAPESMVIFITSHHEYVRQAITLDAFQYLEKPLDKEELAEELDRAVARYHHQRFHYVLTWNGEEFLVELKHIYYFEAKQRTVILNGKNVYRQNKKLDLIEDQLKDFGFLRIHKSYLVNMAMIAGFRKHEMRLLTPDKEVWLPISRQRLEMVRQAYVAYRNQVGV